MLDAERKQETRERGSTASLDRRDQVLRPFGRDLADLHNSGSGAIALAPQGDFLRGVDPLLHRQQVVERELVEIGHRLHVAKVAQVLDITVAQAFDIHRAARGEVADRLLALGAASEPPRAAPCGLAFLAHDFRAAHPARRRHRPGRRVGVAVLGHDADDFGDHVAGAAHDHGVANAHVQSRDLIGVVQGRTGDDDAAHLHRLQSGDRRGGAGAADLDLDRLQHCGLLLRRKFVRDGPTRRTRNESHLALAREVVELVDDAVDIERQRGAFLANAAVIAEQSVQPYHEIVFCAHR